ncbi:MAG: Ig-like domain-containing protein, partial [Gammaproteobacteria bacterium]
MESIRPSGRLARALLYLCVTLPLLVLTTGSADHEARVLWVNANRSVFKVSPVDGTPELELAALPRVQALAVDPTTDHVWVYSHKHLWAYDAQGNALVNEDLPHDFHGDAPAGMVVDGNAGNLWIGIHRRLYRFDLAGKLQATLDLKRDIRGLTLDSTRSHLWVAERHTLQVLDQTGATLFTLPLHRDESPAALAYDADLDQVWLVSGHTLTRYDATGHGVFTARVPGDGNDFLAPDGQGSLWAAGDRTLSYINESGGVQFTLRPFATDSDADHDTDRRGRILALVADPLLHTAWVADGRYLKQYAPDSTLMQTVDIRSFTAPGHGGTGDCRDHQGDHGEQADCGARRPGWSDFWHGRRGIHHVVLYVDTIPPTVSIASPTNGLYTNHPQLPLVLTYSDVGSGVDPSTLRVTNDGVAVPENCVPNPQATGATCTPVSPLPDGKYELRVTVADYAGNVSQPAEVYFTVDTIPPIITLTSPTSGYTNQPHFTIAGRMSEAGTLTINGINVALNSSFAFSDTVLLSEGNNTLTFVATDLAGNVTTLVNILNLNTVPPADVNNGLISVTGPTNGQVTITGKAGSVAPNVNVTITDTKTSQSITVAANGDGSFIANLAASSNDSLQVTETDRWGNVTTDPNTIAVSNLPPDPSTVATPLSATGLTTFVNSTSFLYSGAEPIQTGVAPDTIVAQRAAVIRSKVLDISGNPLPGVTISIQGHPELGQTLSRDDGMFDLAVNGGGLMTLNYSKQGYIGAQRTIQTPWRNYVIAPDVMMIQPDPKVTSVDFGATAPLQIAQGSVETDSDGNRQATVLFPAGTTATMFMPDGSTQPIATAEVRATEFTVGPNGPEAMPAELPPASAYTYAIDLSMDEAVAAGATSVQFNQPVMVYVNNFLGLPVGSGVPSGYYDSSKSTWVPSQDGLVIKILDINAQGLADLDVDGSGTPATATQLTALGISDAERAQLAVTYKAGASLWRVPVTHFTAWDFNLGYSPTADEELPPEQPKNKNINPPDTKDSNICPGCQINAQGQILGENIPITGTAYSLHYSSQTPLSISRHSENIAITTATVPTGLKRIELDIDIAGQHFTETFGTAPNQNYTFTWNGLDAYGRTLTGPVTATFQLAYVYQVPYDVFLENSYHGPWFGRTPPSGQTMAGFAHNGRNEVAATRQWTDTFWSYAPNALGIDRWSIDVHNTFDPQTGTLYEGNGTVRQGSDINALVTTVAGNGTPGVSGDGGPARQALVWDPADVKIAPDGSIYFSMTGCVRKITPDGIIHTYAGMCGKGGPSPTTTPVPATSVSITPDRIALGNDGSLYIQNTYQILRVTPNGMIYVVAGAGGGPPEPNGRPIDGEPAQEATFWDIFSFTVGYDGSIYLSDAYANGG